jgi:diamine N-acetyltransferase
VKSSHRPFMQHRVDLTHCSLRSGLSPIEADKLSVNLAAMDPWLTLGFQPKTLSAYFVRDDSALHRYAVLVDENVAGVICIRYPWLRGPYIELMGLLSDCQGRGLGKELLAWVESEVAGHARNLWLVTSSFNRRALHVYQKAGYQLLCQIESLVVEGKDELLLRKQL